AFLFDYYLKNEITPDISLYAETEYNVYGSSVSSAGDVNGDGYSDVIVGAYNYNSGTGRAYIYLGGPAMDNIADVTITGSANYFMGVSVSTAGDVNGDGYSDVIVGAYGYNSSTGRAYIYYGGAVMNNIADVILTGSATGDKFGESVSDAGDVNGDGYSDVIVGARFNDFIAVDAGAAYIYFGGSSMNNTLDVTLTGEAAND
ncbi:MAG: FG-GAP repeat protein, partial [Ignavibacteriae bacterium]|nr:FG-GAP repeat protein [Ignavibacteriota bacterium]